MHGWAPGLFQKMHKVFILVLVRQHKSTTRNAMSEMPTKAKHGVTLQCWAEARIKIARMTLTIKLDGNWSSFQLANSAPPLSVTDSAIAPSARINLKEAGRLDFIQQRSTWPTSSTIHMAQHLQTNTAFSQRSPIVGRSSQAYFLKRNSAMDDSIGGS